MQCNVGCFERNLRIIVGVILITLAITDQIGDWGWIGVVPLLTGIIRYCPLYSLMKRSSCCKDKNGGCH